MKSVHPLIVALGLLIATSARAGTLDLGAGTIDLPPGTHMQPGHGLDSAIGSLVSSDGTPEVGYDIGGQFDAPILPRKELTFYRHGTTNGVPWGCLSDQEHAAVFAERLVSQTAGDHLRSKMRQPCRTLESVAPHHAVQAQEISF